ncbi:hypothetical protein [Sphingomonas sp. Mn802worker]|uniref:hypothetical protein n=1 Tax=Sphingomonas sp. Mn802worker TaxID=629773 RepID=UPI00138AFCE2|nr:hypothetical protein [Sphingomonas sp. Mn802worker]
MHTIGTGGNGRSGKTARNGETLFRASRTSFLPVLERCLKTDRQITPIGGRLQSLSYELNERTLLRYARLKADGPLTTHYRLCATW